MKNKTGYILYWNDGDNFEQEEEVLGHFTTREKAEKYLMDHSLYLFNKEDWEMEEPCDISTYRKYHYDIYEIYWDEVFKIEDFE